MVIINDVRIYNFQPAGVNRRRRPRTTRRSRGGRRGGAEKIRINRSEGFFFVALKVVEL